MLSNRRNCHNDPVYSPWSHLTRSVLDYHPITLDLVPSGLLSLPISRSFHDVVDETDTMVTQLIHKP